MSGDAPLSSDERERLERLEASLDDFARLAHRLNNPLTALMGRAQLIRRRDAEDERMMRLAEEIESMSKRLADDVRDLASTVRALRDGPSDRAS